MLTTNDGILQTLRKISQAGKDVRLINIYKGFPVAYPARILSIGIDAVTFKVHRYQALCLWLENQTYIQSDEFPEIVRALAVTVNLENEIVALSNFEFVSGAPGNREDARLLVRKTINVYLTIGSQRLRTELRDLSGKGMAVILDAAYYDPTVFKPDEPLRLTFQLPGAGELAPRDVELHGVIRSIIRDRALSYRIGIQITPHDQESVLVSQYFAQRQTEVMEEIEMLHTSILGLSGNEEDDLENG
jgi:hypothetical protein